jgi:hypothetical protein
VTKGGGARFLDSECTMHPICVYCGSPWCSCLDTDEEYVMAAQDHRVNSTQHAGQTQALWEELCKAKRTIAHLTAALERIRAETLKDDCSRGHIHL